MSGVVPDNTLRAVALGMADGQLEQADMWLEVAAGRARRPTGRRWDTPLVNALLHLRSALGWLEKAASL